MHQTFNRALVVLLVFIPGLVCGQYCIFKECICSGTGVDCEERGLTSIPALIPAVGDFTSLNLDINGITSVPEGSLPPNLTGLYLSQNPITTVVDKAFDDSASTLQILFMSSALFTRIPDAFGHLKSLKSLNINDMNITDWNDEAIKNIGQTITSLYLDKVGLKFWPNWLHYFSHLSMLTITTNSISFIPDVALDNVTNTLTILTLNNNKLTQVPKAISRLKALTQLFLQQNQIVGVTWLPPNSKLTALWLNNNLITDANLLSDALRPYADSLLDLDITYNRLTSIGNLTYLTLINIFDFSFNRVSDPDSGSLAASVKSVDLNHNFLPAIPRALNNLQFILQVTLPYNSIRHIQASDFPPSASFIELENNLIVELTDTSFPSSSIITTINLNNNPIVTISNGAFKMLSHLNELDLQGTRLTRLPLALSSINSLFLLDLTNNAQLVCTCEEKSLETWVLKMSGSNILGRCGLMDIQHFFTQLIPSCPS